MLARAFQIGRPRQVTGPFARDLTLAVVARFGERNLVRGFQNVEQNDTQIDEPTETGMTPWPLLSGVTRTRELRFSNTQIGTTTRGSCMTFLFWVYLDSSMSSQFRYFAAQGPDSGYDWRLFHHSSGAFRFQRANAGAGVIGTLGISSTGFYNRPVGLLVRAMHNARSGASSSSRYNGTPPGDFQDLHLLDLGSYDSSLVNALSNTGAGGAQHSHTAITLCRSDGAGNGLSYNLDNSGMVSAFAWNRWLGLHEIYALARAGPLGPLALQGRRRRFATAVAGDVTISPSAVAATMSVVAPTLTYDSIKSPSPVAATMNVVAPTLTYSVLPAAIAANMQVVAPALTYDTNLVPSPVAATMSVVAPTISYSVAPSPVQVTMNVPAPTITIGGGVSLAPDAVATTMAVVGPAISYGTIITPDPVAVNMQIAAPTVDPGAGGVTGGRFGDLVWRMDRPFDRHQQRESSR